MSPCIKLDRNIVVVSRERLLFDDEFEGFRTANELDYQSRILTSYEWMRRRDAESDPRYKQPICCAIVVNRSDETVFVAQKLKGSSESRLHGTWSCCIGGHIEEEDVAGEGTILEQGFLRERDEELILSDPPPVQLFGYLNDDSSEVSKVHFGVMYLVALDSSDCRLRDETLAHGSFQTLHALETMCVPPHNVVDDWARFMIAPLKAYFASVGAHSV